MVIIHWNTDWMEIKKGWNCKRWVLNDALNKY